MSSITVTRRSALLYSNIALIFLSFSLYATKTDLERALSSLSEELKKYDRDLQKLEQLHTVIKREFTKKSILRRKLAAADYTEIWKQVANYGGEATVNTFLDAGFDIEAVVDTEERTPLLVAAATGNFCGVKALLARGASTTTKDKNGMDATMNTRFLDRVTEKAEQTHDFFLALQAACLYRTAERMNPDCGDPFEACRLEIAKYHKS